MHRIRDVVLWTAWGVLCSGCVGPVAVESAAEGSTVGADRAPFREVPAATQLETQWLGVADLPPPNVATLREDLEGGLLLMSSEHGETEILALASHGHPIGKLVIRGHEARGIAWHSDGFLTLGGVQLLWRIELDGTTAPMGWPRPVSFRPVEGNDGSLWLAEEEDVEPYDPDVLYEGGEDYDGPPPEDPPDEGEPAPCFMDVAAEGSGILALDVIPGEVVTEDGVVVFDAVPDDVESLAWHDDSIWLGNPFDGDLMRVVGGELTVPVTLGELGWPGYGVAALEAVDGAMTILATQDGATDGGRYVVLRMEGDEVVELSQAGGAWRDLAVVR
jgi:hypothetical protein